MVKKNCQDCGCVFECAKTTIICHKCHQKRLSMWAKKRNLNKLGNDAYSKQQARKRAEDGK